MDFGTFLTTIVSSVAWPVAVVVIALLFKKPLAELIPLLKTIEGRGFRAEFGKGVREVHEVAESAFPEPAQPRLSRSSLEDRALDLLAISPGAAVLEAWREVEQAAMAAGQRHQVAIPLTNLRGVAEKLHAAAIIGREQMRVFDQLRQLRNLAVHGDRRAITEDDALEFVDLAVRLATFLRQA